MIEGIHHVGLQAPVPAQALAPFAHFFGVPVHHLGGQAWLAAANGFLVASQGAAPERTASVHAIGLAHICLQAQEARTARERLESQGIQLLADPVSLGTGFRYCYARDPAGRLIEMETGTFLQPDPQGWLAHAAFVTDDLDRITSFYSDLLGLPLSLGPRVAGHPGVDAVAQLKGIDLEAVWIRGLNLTLEFWRYHAPALSEPGERQCAYTHLALVAGDPELAHARALALGAQGTEVMDLLGERAPSVLDPDGNRLVFMRPRRGALQMSDLVDASLIDHVLPAREAFLAARAAERAGS
jgi:catechol 2,3-dioxygenase-like lactoylglutathione lyase family enzyme